MHIFGVLILLAAFATLTMGVYVFARNPRNTLNQSFLFLTIGALYWISSFLAFTQSHNFEYAFFWRRIFSFWPFIIPLQFQFIMVFTEKKELLKRIPILLSLLIPAIIITFFELNNLIFENLELEYWGWVEVNSLNFPFVISSLWGVVMGILSLLLILNYYRTIGHSLKKQQAKFVFLGLLIPNMLGILSQIVFSSFSIRFPDLTIPAVGFMCVIIAYGILRYQLFTLTPITAVDSILSFMTAESFGKSITEHSFDLVYAVDSQGYIIYLSPSFEVIMDYKRSEAIGKKFQDFLLPNDTVETNLALFKFLIQPSEKLQMWEEAEVKFKRKDNSTVVLLTRSKPIIREGNMYGVQGIAKDITQLRDAEIKKLEFEKSREDFIAIASHELRTPLTIIRGYTDFLERNIQTLEAELIIPFLQTMVKNINRLENLINNVSSIGSIDRAGFKVIFQKFTINPLLIESLKPFEILLGNQLITSIPKAKIIVKGDPDKIQNVVYNLLENSVNHTLKENREIRVSVITSKDKVRILVRDNGDGIAHKNLEKIFGQYVSIPTENCTKGTGIGLFISKKVIEAHNGTLTAESPGIGMGAIFKVELPLFGG